jgi:DNA-binding NarL/FixJ family response regulator
MTLHILLADDHLMFRRAIRMVLRTEPDIALVAEANNGLEALQLARDNTFDVVCMDINMPLLDGIETTRQLLAAHPKIKVIGLSSHVDPFLIVRMINAGAHAYVDKSCAGGELLTAVRTVTNNGLFISPALGNRRTAELMQLVNATSTKTCKIIQSA